VLALLVVAWALEPDPSGVGTHTQLGLRGCSVLSWTGVPCPMCGMTTAFSAMAHLRVRDALVAHPVGSLFACLFAVAGGVSLVELVSPRGRWESLLALALAHEGKVAVAVLGCLVVGWLYKIWMMAI
jgi:hypothetical protein